MGETEPTGSGPDWSPGEVVTLLEFVADAGKEMLESSTSVSEVEDRLREFLRSVGLGQCALEAMMSSLIMSYPEPGSRPITIMREIRVAEPRLARLAGAYQLLDAVEDRSIGLDEAVRRLDALPTASEASLFDARWALGASVVGWVLFVGGLDVVTVLVAIAATACTLPVGGFVHRLRFPSLATTFLVATIVAAIPNLLAAAGLSLLIGPAIVGALFPHLPGRAFVSSVIDGLANAPLSSISRGVQAVATAGFLALGMLVGSRIGTGFGLSYEPDATATPLGWAIAGAALGVFGLAVAWGMPRPQLLPTVVLSAVGWLIVALATDRLTTQSDWPLYALAAGVVGLVGALVSAWQRSSASIYIGVAILPLVPGLTLYSGMLAVAEGERDDAVDALVNCGVVSLAIAIGVALGLGVGHNVVATSRRVVHRSGG